MLSVTDINIIYIFKQFSYSHILDKAKGFGFVEFETEEDCAAALENMHGAELYGKVLRCNIAKPMANKNVSGMAVWTADDWISNQMKDDDFDGIDKIETDNLQPTNS